MMRKQKQIEVEVGLTMIRQICARGLPCWLEDVKYKDRCSSEYMRGNVASVKRVDHEEGRD